MRKLFIVSAIGVLSGSFVLPAMAASNCNCLNVTVVNKTKSDCKITNKPSFGMGSGKSQTLQTIAVAKNKDTISSGYGRMCSSLDSGPNVTLDYTCGDAMISFKIEQSACETRGGTPKVITKKAEGLKLDSQVTSASFPDMAGKVVITLSDVTNEKNKSKVMTPHQFSSKTEPSS